METGLQPCKTLPPKLALQSCLRSTVFKIRPSLPLSHGRAFLTCKRNSRGTYRLIRTLVYKKMNIINIYIFENIELTSVLKTGYNRFCTSDMLTTNVDQIVQILHFQKHF